jgi:hypothetical protein
LPNAGNPEVIWSSVELVSRNALVLTGLAPFRVVDYVGNSNTIQKTEFEGISFSQLRPTGSTPAWEAGVRPAVTNQTPANAHCSVSDLAEH